MAMDQKTPVWFQGLKPFDPSDPDFSADHFLQKFDLLKSISGWDDALAAHHFKLYLTAGPLNWCRNLSEDQRKSYTELRNQFLLTYGSNSQELFDNLSVFQRKMNDTESVSEFLADLYIGFSRIEIPEKQLMNAY